jgi:hypothetical protein
MGNTVSHQNFDKYETYVVLICVFPFVAPLGVIIRLVLLSVDFFLIAAKVGCTALLFPCLVAFSLHTFLAFLDEVRNKQAGAFTIYMFAVHIVTIFTECVTGCSLIRHLHFRDAWSMLDLRTTRPFSQASVLVDRLAPRKTMKLFWILVLPSFYAVMTQQSVSLIGQYYFNDLYIWGNYGAVWNRELHFLDAMMHLYSASADTVEVVALFNLTAFMLDGVREGILTMMQQGTLTMMRRDQEVRSLLHTIVQYSTMCVMSSLCFVSVADLFRIGLINACHHGHLEDDFLISFATTSIHVSLSEIHEIGLTIKVLLFLLATFAVFNAWLMEHYMAEQLKEVGFLHAGQVTGVRRYLRSKLLGVKLIISVQFTALIILWILHTFFHVKELALKMIYHSFMVLTCPCIAGMHWWAWEPSDFFLQGSTQNMGFPLIASPTLNSSMEPLLPATPPPSPTSHPPTLPAACMGAFSPAPHHTPPSAASPPRSDRSAASTPKSDRSTQTNDSLRSSSIIGTPSSSDTHQRNVDDA